MCVCFVVIETSRCLFSDNNQADIVKHFIGGLVSDACLWLGPPWLNLSFSLALTISESWARFIISLFHHSVLDYFSVMIHCISLEASIRAKQFCVLATTESRAKI